MPQGRRSAATHQFTLTSIPSPLPTAGFTAGSASGPGSSFQAKTITETTSPFGNSNSKADISIKSEIGGLGGEREGGGGGAPKSHGTQRRSMPPALPLTPLSPSPSPSFRAGLYGSAASSTISGIGGLSSDSRAIGFAREGRFGSAVSTAFTLGGYGGQASTSTDANTGGWLCGGSGGGGERGLQSSCRGEGRGHEEEAGCLLHGAAWGKP